VGLVKCEDCGREVSDRAAACPHCGCPTSKRRPSEATVTPSASQQPTHPSQSKKRLLLLGVLGAISVSIAVTALVVHYQAASKEAEIHAKQQAEQDARDLAAAQARDKAAAESEAAKLAFEDRRENCDRAACDHYRLLGAGRDLALDECCQKFPPSEPAISCPSNARLVAAAGSMMLSKAPSGALWKEPAIELCTPIKLPTPAWYVVGDVVQDSPMFRTERFHLVIDARAWRLLAISEPAQRSTHQVCDAVQLASVEDHGESQSAVVTRERCVDKMEQAHVATYRATISPPQITVDSK